MLPLIQDVADALDYAYAQGIVHRDVKPSNVMPQPITTTTPTIGPYRSILMDFGIAKLLEDSSGLTQMSTVGTLAYIAPEQIIASTTLDGRAEVYALGIMTYQMFTGRPPFVEANAAGLVLAHLQRPPPDPRKAVLSLPPAGATAVLKALAKEPFDRFPTAGAFVAALQ